MVHTLCLPNGPLEVARPIVQAYNCVGISAARDKNLVPVTIFAFLPSSENRSCDNSTARGERHMPDQPSQPPNDRFKAEMPDIPGLSGPAPKPRGAGGPWLVMAGLVAVLIAVFVGGRI